MKDGSKDIISLIAYCLENNVYIELPGIYDKVLYNTMEEDVWGNFGTEDLTIDYGKIDKIVGKMSMYLSNSFDEDKFKEEKTTVKLGGKDVKVTKVIYPLTKDTVYDMAVSILNDAKNDEEFIKLLADFSDSDYEELKEEINKTKINKSDFEFEVESEFYLYTTGFFSKVVGFGYHSDGYEEMVQHGDLYRNEFSPKVDISYVKIDKNGSFKFYVDDVEVVATINDTKAEGTVKVEKEELAKFTLNYVEKDKNTKIDLNVSMNIEEVKFVLDFKLDMTEQSDKKTKFSYDINVKAENDEETFDASLKLNLNVEIDGNVQGVNTNGAVSVENLTEADSEKISINLENAIKDTFLYDLLFMQSEPGYDDDFYDDYDDDDYWYDDEYEYEF